MSKKNMGPKKGQDSVIEDGVKKYELRAPDGGWGYVIALATIIAFCGTLIPMSSFGLIFGDYLNSVGDETTGTALMNGMFNTVSSFTGLIANGVLNRYSYRKVGFIGTIIYVLGASGVVFSQDLLQLITFFGVVQGLGFGLMMPAVYSAFNSYFNEKMAVMMSIAQAFMVASSMMIPPVATWSMTTFGFRGTLVGLVLLAALSFPAMVTLQPVKWHMKKVPIDSSNINDAVLHIQNNDNKTLISSDLHKFQVEPLLKHEKPIATMTASQKSLNDRVILPKTRRSIISLGDRAASVNNIHDLRELKSELDISEEEENLSILQAFMKSMDMSLLKDARYLNISIGLALCFTADVAFVSIIPLMLGNVGLDSKQIAFTIIVFFGSDLVSRILLTVISGMFQFRSRNLVLFAALFSAIFRTAFIWNDTYIWKISILGVLGFLRCFIQTPLPLVISEEYSERFSTAFSLYMAVNGVVSLVFGLLMSFIKTYTQSDVMVCHSLTMAFTICVVAWITELTFFRKKSIRDVQK